MVGACIALITAFAWAISSIILKSIADKIDTLSINTIRMWIGCAILITIVLVTNKYGALVDVPLKPLIWVIVSGICAMAPLFALPFSILILKEKPTRNTIAGIFFSVGGVCLVVV